MSQVPPSWLIPSFPAFCPGFFMVDFFRLFSILFAMKNTHFAIRIAGPAGLGMHSIMDIVANAFASSGQHIITDSEYQSIIK